MKNLIIIILIFFSYLSIAQHPVIFDKPFIEDSQVNFIRLTTDNGLSHNRVTDIIQDIHGFVWIATLDGLNRYDGKQFEIFKNNKDNFTSISSSYISCLAEGKNGDLYVGTDHGLNKYNRLTNSFSLINLNSSGYKKQNPHIRQLLFDNDSLLWIETLDGYLISYDVKNMVIVKYYKHPTVYQTYYLYHSLYKDKSGTLWVGTRNMPPMYLDEIADKLIVIPPDEFDHSKKRDPDMACYYEDSNNNFWITALDGIYLFDKETEVFTKFLSTSTYDVKEDFMGNIWFASGSGVLKYNPQTNIITQFENEKDNANSISNNSIHNILEDNMGNLWFSTSEGVNIYSHSAYSFQHFTHIPGISNSPEGYSVTAVAEDKENNLWIGYKKDGLDYFNRKTGKFIHFLHDHTKPNTLASNKVSALYLDKKDRLWIGLWRGIGFNMFDTRSEQFSLFTYNPESMKQDWYNDFTEDKSGNFYIGFWGADGLTGFNRETKQFLSSFKNKFDRIICSRLITKLLLDSKGSIWFGTTDCGLHRYFPETDSAISYFSDDSISVGLSSNKINDITEDSFGNIWLINDVLQKYIPENDTFISYGFSNGLTTKELAALLSDNEGNIWVSTHNQGLYKFNTKDCIFSQFVKQDGLKSNSFTAARKKLNNGDLFFGNKKGFNIFNPNEIVENTVIPVPYFGRLYVSDHIVSHDLNQQSEIVLTPDENVFTVELLSSDIVNPERYSYQCMLDGYDEGWVDIDNKQRVVRYTAVPPGNYKLSYRIGNRKGIWSAETSDIWFKIKKPFYITWWFITFVISFVILLLFLYIKRREFDLKNKHRNLELQQRLFRLQMNPHFMFNSLLAIQNFIFLHNSKDAGNYLSDFAHLFRLILNNSKSEFITIEKEVETLNLYLKLQKLRYPDKFIYNIIIDPEIDTEHMMIPPMLAQPMIENALEHGIFYKKGKGNIDIRFKYYGNHLLFEVEDNGIGLVAAKKKVISKPHHQSSALKITHERIKVLGKRHSFYAIFEINELKDIDGNVAGTKVIFTIPYKMLGKHF